MDDPSPLHDTPMPTAVPLEGVEPFPLGDGLWCWSIRPDVILPPLAPLLRPATRRRPRPSRFPLSPHPDGGIGRGHLGQGAGEAGQHGLDLFAGRAGGAGAGDGALGIVVPSLRRDRNRLVAALQVAAAGIQRSRSARPWFH